MGVCVQAIAPGHLSFATALRGDQMKVGPVAIPFGDESLHAVDDRRTVGGEVKIAGDLEPKQVFRPDSALPARHDAHSFRRGE